MSKILDSRCLPQGKSGWPRCNAISLTHVDGAGGRTDSVAAPGHRPRRSGGRRRAGDWRGADRGSWSSGASGLAQVLEHLAGGFGLWIVRRPAWSPELPRLSGSAG